MNLDKTGFPVGPTSLPWDDLGSDVSGCTTSAEVLAKAGLDWLVKTESAYVKMMMEEPDPQVYWTPAMNSLFTVRGDLRASDIHRVLGHVSSSFSVSQNCDTFALFDRLVAEGQLVYERAGSFKYGRVVWLVARINTPWGVVGADGAIEGYMVLRNAHDGSGSLEILFVAVDLTTSSCVSFPVKGIPHRMRLRHTRTTGDRAAKASARIQGAAAIYLSQNLGRLHNMERISVSDDLVTRILLDMYPGANTNRADGVAIRSRAAIHDLFMGAEKRTGYALWHGICAFLDHSKASCRVGNNIKESRMHGILWGSRALKRQNLGSMLLTSLSIGG